MRFTAKSRILGLSDLYGFGCAVRAPVTISVVIGALSFTLLLYVSGTRRSSRARFYLSVAFVIRFRIQSGYGKSTATPGVSRIPCKIRQKGRLEGRSRAGRRYDAGTAERERAKSGPGALGEEKIGTMKSGGWVVSLNPPDSPVGLRPMVADRR